MRRIDRRVRGSALKPSRTPSARSARRCPGRSWLPPSPICAPVLPGGLVLALPERAENGA